jgi:hypothetical protein
MDCPRPALFARPNPPASPKHPCAPLTHPLVVTATESELLQLEERWRSW